MRRFFVWLGGVLSMVAMLAPSGLAQRGGGPPGGGGPGAPGGAQGPMRTPDVELVERFDLDKNGWLTRPERDAARVHLAELAAGRGRGGRGGGRGGAAEPPPTGRRLTPADVSSHAGRPLFEPGILRTLFLEFEHEDWEDELAAFHRTDVDVPATLRADGRTYEHVGIQFRGNSSFSSVPKGRKRSMTVTLDLVNGDQRLEGYRGTTLLNAHSDPTFLRSVLYLHVAGRYLPTLKANFVRLVINGESWGVYVNQQRFNRDFVRDAFGTEEGIRIRSSNRSRGGGLSYLGEDPNEYRQWYEIQTADRDDAWKPLIRVTKVLHETPPERLAAALAPVLDIDSALRFLALDMIMMSGDGYWLYGSDYNIYIDAKGVLRLVHHDANESFMAQGGGGGGRGGGGGGVRTADADPLGYMDDPNKALRHRLLAVPELRTKYLEYVRDIARDALDWSTIGPTIDRYRALIAADVKADTRKLYSTEEFTAATFADGSDTPAVTSLKGFIQQRREYLLNHPAIRGLK